MKLFEGPAELFGRLTGRKEVISNCPSCGGPLGKAKGGSCPYCSSAIGESPTEATVAVPKVRDVNAGSGTDISVGESHRAPMLRGKRVKVGSFSNVGAIVGKDVTLGKYVTARIVLADDRVSGKGDMHGVEYMQGADIDLGPYSHVERLVFSPRKSGHGVRLQQGSSVGELLVVGRDDGFYPECGDNVTIGKVRPISEDDSRKLKSKAIEGLSGK